jgi:chaperone BCS1
LEDIDAAFKSREELPVADKKDEEKKKDDVDKSSVTMKGLLNAIDGIRSAEPRLLMMTTNYIDRLDKAMLRPGMCA